MGGAKRAKKIASEAVLITAVQTVYKYRDKPLAQGENYQKLLANVAYTLNSQEINQRWSFVYEMWREYIRKLPEAQRCEWEEFHDFVKDIMGVR